MNMWSYWRDKKGVRLALEDQYPELAEKDEILRGALTQIKIAEMALNFTIEDETRQTAEAMIQVAEMAIEARMEEIGDEGDPK